MKKDGRERGERGGRVREAREERERREREKKTKAISLFSLFLSLTKVRERYITTEREREREISGHTLCEISGA
jgi:hypothetical protein